MVKVFGLCAAILWISSSLQTLVGVESELVLLVTLTRHGSRAPNPVVMELCPNNDNNRLQYNVPPGQLTEKGMKQALKLGEFLRETYVETVKFLPPTLGGGNQSSFSSRFMSDSADRCIQTAQAMAQGLFPDGAGPPGFPNQPVAVQTEQKQFANVLAAAHGACLAQQKADNKVYDESRGKQIVHNAENITAVVAKACGASVSDYVEADGGKEGLVLGVKDVGDMLDFDEQQGLARVSGVSKEIHESMTALAFTLLQERYYSSQKQVTYWAGGLPSQLLDDFESASKRHATGDKPKRLYIGYHGHRELLYGLAHLLGWTFSVPGMPIALGTSSIPPGTTMFFELHYHAPDFKNEASAGKASPSSPSQLSDPSQSTDGSSQGIQGSPEEAEAKGSSEGVTGSLEGVKGSPEGAKEYYYVRTYTWTPQFGQQEVVLDICAGKTAGVGCPLTTLKNSVLDGLVDTGTWEDICQHVPFTEAEKMAKKIVFEDNNIMSSSSSTPSSASGSGSGSGRASQPQDKRSPAGSDRDESRLTWFSLTAVAVAAGLVLFVAGLVAKSKWGTSAARKGEDYEVVL